MGERLRGAREGGREGRKGRGRVAGVSRAGKRESGEEEWGSWEKMHERRRRRGTGHRGREEEERA